jgi:hypothetical protein
MISKESESSSDDDLPGPPDDPQNQSIDEENGGDEENTPKDFRRRIWNIWEHSKLIQRTMILMTKHDFHL